MCGFAPPLAAPARAASAERSVRFDIPAQNLAATLDQIARQSGVQILYPYTLAAARRGGALHARMTVRAALDRMLRGSGLTVVRVTDRLVILHAAAAAPSPLRPSSGPRGAMPTPPPLVTAPPRPLEDIVVTGRASEAPLDETELSYAVTRLDAAALARKGPQSTADLFKQVPGFWVEATGGEASNNVRSRGIPTDGYSSVALLEDGLPVQYDGGLGYLNTDQIYRVDSTIDRAEAVRGGPSAIFMANAPGGSLNFITRTGLRHPGYTLSVTGGGSGYQRVDGFAGARIAPNLGVSLGGFYRRDDGLRDPGYRADQGGQLRAGIDYDDGHIRLAFNVKRLDDRVILYLPVPLRFEGRGDVRAIPGFDPLRDTLAGPDTEHVLFKTANGPRDFDLSKGTRSRITFYTLSGRLGLGDRGALELNARLRTGDTLRNGLFPIGRPVAGGDYLASVLPQLTAAYPATATAALRYADTGAPFQRDGNGNGLVVGGNLLSVRMPMTEFIGDARLTRSMDRFGHHDIALGLTYADTRLDFARTIGTVLLDVRGQARRLDVVALDAAGRRIGALTDGGFVRYGSLFDNVSIRASNIAIYAADEWKIAPRWRIDLGGRWERIRIGGGAEGSMPVDLGDPATLADNAVLTGNGVIAPIRRAFSGVNGTIGLNFRPSQSTGLFMRLTRIARLPGATDFNSSPNRTDDAVVPITMAEAGIILSRPHWRLSAVGYGTRFARLPFTDFRFDTASNAYVERTSIADTSTIGLELAGHADLAGPLALDAQATLQDPRYRNFSYVELVGAQPVTHDATGNQLIRVPRLSLRLTPSLTLLAGRLRVDTEFTHYSARFSDIANTQRLPPYSLVNVNVNAKITDHLAFAFHITNLTNTLGLTEGNPRAGAFDAGGSGISYFLARPEFGRTLRATLRASW
ncbi:TonB-dependent receptor [Sphingomonas sp. H39-1-10]|uniref:TonB-dependent receptor domain-containing protein n=1 Tax=Sphingomonas pollutisoli TaxID=3030829 RepID=UPI0023BA2238|nr:TonB-dependent receptor [Sphingomonas pollutisoli]MDF0488077.1 TonB-dependent receptor [Sphingomonas pollutisoli]